MLAVAVISLLLGVAVGLKFGGHLAIRRIRDFEHAERTRRAGLGKRS